MKKHIFILFCFSLAFNSLGQSLPDMFSVQKVINIRHYSIKDELKKPLTYSLFNNTVFSCQFLGKGKFKIVEYKSRIRRSYKLSAPIMQNERFESLEAIAVNERNIAIHVNFHLLVFDRIKRTFLYSINVPSSGSINFMLQNNLLHYSEWYKYDTYGEINHKYTYDLSNYGKCIDTTYLNIQPDYFSFISPHSLVDYNHDDSVFIVMQNNLNKFRVLANTQFVANQEFEQDSSVIISKSQLDTLRFLSSLPTNKKVMGYCFKLTGHYKYQWNTAIYYIGNSQYLQLYTNGDEFDDQNNANVIQLNNDSITNILPISMWGKLRDTASKTFYFFPNIENESKQDQHSNKFLYSRRSVLCKVKKGKTVLDHFQRNRKLSRFRVFNRYRIYVCEWNQ
jgi:hypothetical protein